MATVSHRPDLSALLRAHHEVLAALTRTRTPEAALAGALAAITGTLGWPAGAVWERTAAGELACTHGRGAERALAERAIAAGEPVWGAGGTVCIPLVRRQPTVAVFELTDPGPGDPEPELVATLASLGLLIGR